jgi:hypothetical protein
MSFGINAFSSKSQLAVASGRSLARPAAVFPGGIAGDINLAVAANRLQTALAVTLSDNALSMTVTDTSQIVTGTLLSIDNEIVQATAAPAGANIPISRGFDGTAPAIHLSGAAVVGLVDAWHHNATATEIQAIEAALGTNLSKIPTSPLWKAETYNFPAIPGAANLNVGSNVITLSPMPAGLAIGNSIYITGGTGTAEAVPITGITGNQVIITCVNTHTGAWTVQSASAGIQEAVVVASAAGGGHVTVRGGTFTMHATINMRSGINICGEGIFISLLTRTEDYGSTFACGTATTGIASIGFSNLYLQHQVNYQAGPPPTMVNRPTRGSHIELNGVNTCVIERTRMDNMPLCVKITGGADITIDTCQFQGLWDYANANVQVTRAAIQTNYGGSSLGVATYVNIFNCRFYGYSSASRSVTINGINFTMAENVGPWCFIEVRSVEVMQIANCSMGGANTYNTYINRNGTDPLLQLSILDNYMDGSRVAQIAFENPGGTNLGSYNTLIMNNNMVGNNVTINGIYIINGGAGSDATAYGVMITNNSITGNIGAGILLDDGKGIQITGNQIRSYNGRNAYPTDSGSDQRGNSGIYFGGKVSKVFVGANQIGGGNAFETYDGTSIFTRRAITDGAAIMSSGAYSYTLPGSNAGVQIPATGDLPMTTALSLHAWPDENLILAHQQAVTGSVAIRALNDAQTANIPLEIRASKTYFNLGTISTLMQTFATNAAAISGGLTAGDFYTDGAGNVKVVF